MICKGCNSPDIKSFYQAERIPAFQNKLFKTKDEAINSPSTKINLVRCNNCDLIFNSEFNNYLMDYNEEYNNAQDHSPIFKEYLNTIADLIEEKNVVEIGCGNGRFMEILAQRGINAIGFEPAYRGNSPHISKAYYVDQKLEVDAVILRHTLEHIEYPIKFLTNLIHKLPNAVFYIEVPRYEWIEEHGAFWDIFHEHCNYFTEKFFSKIFDGAIINRTFNDQYMVVRC